MPKRAHELTARTVATLKTQGRHAVGGAVGLYLRVEGKNRWWVLRIKTGGRRQDLGLGRYPDISLADARDHARARRKAFSETVAFYVGHHSGAAREHPQAATPSRAELAAPTPPVDAPTFASCARTYIGAQESGWKSAKHGEQWRSTLEAYAFPVIGELHPNAVTTDHILRILRPIWSTKTETATRVRGRIEVIFDWAEHRGYRHGKNPAGWEGNLKHELPSPTKLKKRKKQHHPALPYTRVGMFMADLRTRRVTADALEWGILTATRYQEIAGARRAEINVELRRWTIPAERMKLEKSHVVPLSDEALALYRRLPIVDGCDLLFPAPEGGPLSNSALGALIDLMHEADLARGSIGYLDPLQGRIATQHGFRSTFRNWAAEVAYFPREVIEHALAHKLKDQAEAAYQRGDMLMKRAILMQQWARFCRDVAPRVPNVLALSTRGTDANTTDSCAR